MPYTSSQAFTPPIGTLIEINTGTPSVPVWQPVLEVLEFTESGRKWSEEKTTNLSSGFEEKLKGLLDSGSFDVMYNYLGADSLGDIALEAAFNAAVPSGFQIVIPGLPSGKTQTIAFSANVMEKDIDKVKRGSVITGKLKLNITSLLVFTEA